MSKRVTKREICDRFWAEVMPYVADELEKDGVPDVPGRQQAWNDWLDGLERNRELTHADVNRIGGIPDRLERKRFCAC